MLRSAARKAMWATKGAALFGGAVLTLALVFGAASVALAANGQPWLLGKANNTATSLTALVADIANPNQAALQVRNSGEGPALELRVGEPGVGPGAKTQAPMRVNSTVKVANLNADKLDNLEPSQIKGAKAYARVIPGTSPSFDTSRTSGFTSVRRDSTGVYCLTAPGLSSANRPAAVSVDWNETNGPEGNASAMYAIALRCSGSEFAVVTQRQSISGIGELQVLQADDVGFDIVVP